LAPQVYVDALKLGIKYFHTAISPLANGASLPAAEDFFAEVLRERHTTSVNEEQLRQMAEYFTWVALSEDKPLGRPLKYDPSLYEHQVPGGMISNLKAQLAMAKLEHRLDEVLTEVSRVREDLGYPIMVSPFAQFLITQATLNVVHGERYRTIPDEIRKYALGYYGRPAAPMASDFLDRATNGAEPVTARPADFLEPGLPRLRTLRGPIRDDDHLLLAAYYDDKLIEPALRPQSNGARALRFVTDPVLELLDYVARTKDIRHARIKVRGLELIVNA
jgi:oxaloacetate decarboxylase alpha subunit